MIEAVAAGAHMSGIPADLVPALQNAANSDYVPSGGHCGILHVNGYINADEAACSYGGNPRAPRIVLLGDSHAKMWASAFRALAQRAGYNFTLLEYSSCRLPLGIAYDDLPPNCAAWRQAAIAWINNRPAIVAVTSINDPGPGASPASYRQFASGWERLLNAITAPGRKLFLLGSIPVLSQDPPDCLAAHESNVQDCSNPTPQAVLAPSVEAEQAAAVESGASYVNPTPWLCTRTVCPAVIGHYDVYLNQYHITSAYGVYLSWVLQAALHVAG
ncbi:MAG: SGNH hydrolase domain-containing protein [Acidimicrobiales bacterium]